MVRSTAIVSALLAFTSSVFAAGKLINIDGGDHIGVNDINLQNFGHEAVDARGAQFRDIGQNIDILDGDFDGEDVLVGPPVRGTRPTRVTNPVVHEHTGDCGHHDHGLCKYTLYIEFLLILTMYFSEPLAEA